MVERTRETTSALLQTMGRRLWGFAPALMPEIVAQQGAARALTWFIRHMPRYERTRSTLGALRTHLVAVEVSLLNGCPYCTFGHAFAFQLLYFKERGQLFPLDEHELVALHAADEALLERALRDALVAGDLGSEVAWLERVVALRAGARPATADDRRIAHLIEMFGVLNACGIRGRVSPDQAHDPINKDRELKARYLARREQERQRPQSIPSNSLTWAMT